MTKQKIDKSGKKKMTAGAWLKEILIIILCAVALAVVVKCFLIDSRQIPSTSMMPTIEVGDRVILWRPAYAFGFSPQRGDIVVFSPPAEFKSRQDLIKRIIGLPGETVLIKDGLVYIDDVPLEEDYLLEAPDYEYGPVTIPEDCYFVLGDNRNDSIDSHRWEEPFLPKENIKGKAVFRYWPLDRLGGI